MRPVFSFSALAIAVLLTGCGGSSTSGTTSPTTYSVGGTVQGLSGTVVLQNNGGDNLTQSSNGNFAFKTTLAPGSAYSVTVLTQPANQTCSVANGSGTLNASVTNVQVTCVSTSTVNQWMWQNGSNHAGAPGSYGSEGTAAAANTPGARRQPVAWTDANGNFWLFGGNGTGMAAGNTGLLNDLWEYSASAGQWVWQGGSETQGAAASYGTLNTAASGNNPGAREGSASWTDPAGNLWLFGGDGAAGQTSEQFNDLWEYQASTAQWVWVGGSNSPDNAGSYGTQLVAAMTNLPPARTGAISWVDSSGVFWLFGGAQVNPNGTLAAVLDDLWSYNPTSGLWTWVGGSSTPNTSGVYGSQGTAAASNLPGARMGASAWVDANGNVWLFGGLGLNQSGLSQRYNDLWEYSPSSMEWTWIGGSDKANSAGIYGTLGASAAGNGPGARASSVAWKDSAGNFWLFGGYGDDQAGNVGALNDLWKYNLSSGLWTWIAGSSSLAASGVYGTQGTFATTNLPGARQQAVGWQDSSGDFWLFGGYGYDAFGEQQDLNDLWVYVPNP